MSYPPLPQNPNTRPPYSDICLELTVNVDDIITYLGISKDAMGAQEWDTLGKRLQVAAQAMLRARAVLDPASLTPTEWEACKKTAWEVAIELGI